MRRALLAVVLLVALIAGWFFTRSAAPPVGTAAPPAVAKDSKVHLPKPAKKPVRRVRQVDPPPVVTPEVSEPTIPTTGTAPPKQAVLDGGSGNGPVDRREHPTGNSEQLRADIMAGMELVRDDVATCIQDWIDAGERVDGKVNIGFQIDADGLQDAWVTDVEAIPDGPKSCFASAIYGVDWSGISEEPLEITMPFTVRAE